MQSPISKQIYMADFWKIHLFCVDKNPLFDVGIVVILKHSPKDSRNRIYFPYLIYRNCFCSNLYICYVERNIWSWRRVARCNRGSLLSEVSYGLACWMMLHGCMCCGFFGGEDFFFFFLTSCSDFEKSLEWVSSWKQHTISRSVQRWHRE